MVDVRDEHGGSMRPSGAPKAKIQIWIKKSDQYQELMAQEEANRASGFRRGPIRAKPGAPTTATVDTGNHKDV